MSAPEAVHATERAVPETRREVIARWRAGMADGSVDPSTVITSLHRALRNEEASLVGVQLALRACRWPTRAAR